MLVSRVSHFGQHYAGRIYRGVTKVHLHRTTHNNRRAKIMNNRLQLGIAGLAVFAIAVHLWLRFGLALDGHVAGVAMRDWPLVLALIFGGVPLVWELLVKLFRAEFGSDLLAGISIVTGVLLGEYLAATIVVLMLSGGEALESYAVRSASSVLRALANRMPSIAIRQVGDTTEEISLDEIAIGTSC